MTDIVSPEVRSRMMAAIKGSNTKPERQVRSFLHRAGLRYVLGGRGLPGRPDIVLPSRRAVVFVHGCYWHRHPGCRFATTPKTRVEFWQRKFDENVARDRRVEDELRQLGWTCFIIWECEIDEEPLVDLVERLRSIAASAAP